ncbi:MAG: hypothetical protein Q4D25_04095, partial [Bacteroidales bacterium]|nr:hypothetical protein [Bacteroidales bacterium]
GETPTPVWVRYLNSYGRADGETLKWCSIKHKGVSCPFIPIIHATRNSRKRKGPFSKVRSSISLHQET